MRSAASRSLPVSRAAAVAALSSLPAPAASSRRAQTRSVAERCVPLRAAAITPGAAAGNARGLVQTRIDVGCEKEFFDGGDEFLQAVALQVDVATSFPECAECRPVAAPRELSRRYASGRNVVLREASPASAQGTARTSARDALRDTAAQRHAFEIRIQRIVVENSPRASSIHRVACARAAAWRRGTVRARAAILRGKREREQPDDQRREQARRPRGQYCD